MPCLHNLHTVCLLKAKCVRSCAHFTAFYQPVSCNSHKHQYSATLKTQLGHRSVPTPWDKKSERGWKRQRGELKHLKETSEACIHTITQTAAVWLVTMCSECPWAALSWRCKKKALPCGALSRMKQITAPVSATKAAHLGHNHILNTDVPGWFMSQTRWIRSDRC